MYCVQPQGRPLGRHLRLTPQKEKRIPDNKVGGSLFWKGTSMRRQQKTAKQKTKHAQMLEARRMRRRDAEYRYIREWFENRRGWRWLRAWYRLRVRWQW